MCKSAASCSIGVEWAGFGLFVFVPCRASLKEGLRGCVESFQDRHSQCEKALSCNLQPLSVAVLNASCVIGGNTSKAPTGGERTLLRSWRRLSPLFFARRLFAETTFALARCAPNTPRLQQVRIKVKGEREPDSQSDLLAAHILLCFFLQ